ncbi:MULTISPECIES: O-antigen ligase family protein [Aestuariimicrobium]|uniref:O-antigen ligase family protein n=1 Tax=Aestuariimicrobium TaxID=396388 RepID=UPI0003B40F62|nr:MULTISPECIES: O-antigen ligase family protein [Aestuariimicrobium]CAI9403032.1 hypothetical protein AESSP_00922 [Aestuariimicrobium sp. T2.26MG-19.2B]
MSDAPQVVHPVAPSGTLDRGLLVAARRGRSRVVRYSRSRGVTRLLWIVAAGLVLRTPLSVVLAALIPLFILLVKGLRWPTKLSAPMWIFLLVALGTSGLAWINNPDLALINNFTLMATMTLVCAAVTLTRHTVAAVRWLMAGTVAGLWICLLTGVFEAVSGIKVLPLLYPDANTAAAVASNRFVVAGFFPNFNDFAVAMAMFGTILTAQLLLGAGVGPLKKMTRAAGLMGCMFFIVVIGARGALVGLALGMVLVVITGARLLNRRLVSVPTLVAVLSVAVFVAAALLTTPYVQDNSALQRVRIIHDSIAMTPASEGHFWYGYGSMTWFRQVAEEVYGPVLMDPHNLLLEFFTMFGLPTLIAYIGLWFHIAHRGLWRLKMGPGWRETSVVVLSALMPVLGIVPSSTLRYYLIYLFIAASIGVFQTEAMRRRQMALADHG